MLRSMQEIIGYTIIDKNDKVVGQAHDFYFDDLLWTTRYLVVNTGTWLPGRKVLISTLVVEKPDWGGGVSFPVQLSKEQIENAPSIDVANPVSRQHEAELAEYYSWSQYWRSTPSLAAPAVGIPPQIYNAQVEQHLEKQKQQEAVLEETSAPEQTKDTHLRSINEVTGYYIRATDDDVGHVEDFIIDTETWTIRYMVIDTRNWLPGKKVIISPQWVNDIEWDKSKVYVALSREQIKNSPEYNPAAPVNREYESRLYDFYGRPKYWD